jgi:hypothetical protein
MEWLDLLCLIFTRSSETTTTTTTTTITKNEAMVQEIYKVAASMVDPFQGTKQLNQILAMTFRMQ